MTPARKKAWDIINRAWDRAPALRLEEALADAITAALEEAERRGAERMKSAAVQKLRDAAKHQAKVDQHEMDDNRHCDLIDALERSRTQLRNALAALRNETRGTLTAHRIAICYDHGNSNWKCLEMALEMADAALAPFEL